MNVYWMVAAAVIILGMAMPQRGRERKSYITIMAILHTFVCGFRYMYLTGDLRKYAAGYETYATEAHGWFSDYVFNGGRNAGFEWLKKGLSMATNGNFQVFLIVLSIISELILAIIIYRYSPKPWLSYLVWNCMSFYITYDFCAIKQGLAMAILMLAMICILENKFGGFLFFTLLAGFVHMPAVAFLPAYWLMNQRVNKKVILLYIVLTGITYFFRNDIVQFLQGIYYAGNDEINFAVNPDRIGGRFIVVLLIALTGAILKGFRDRRFAGLFNIVMTAAIFQMFSMYDNVFTRLADYYLQFTVLYIPMIFFDSDDKNPIDKTAAMPVLSLTDSDRRLLAALLTVILIWWYYKTALGVTIINQMDNYLNYHFMWDVVS